MTYSSTITPGLQCDSSCWLATFLTDSFLQFIDDTPDLFKLVQTQNRAQKLLAYLGDLVVNGSSIEGQEGEPGLTEEIIIPKLQNRTEPTGPVLDTSVPCELGWRNIIVNHGPEAFAKAVRQYPGTLIMDTTWRDAHQSLLKTRLRTIDMAGIAKETSWALANAYSLECWGGATFDVALRFLYEDPWERLVSRPMLTLNTVLIRYISEDFEETRSEYSFPGFGSRVQRGWIHKFPVSIVYLHSPLRESYTPSFSKRQRNLRLLQEGCREWS